MSQNIDVFSMTYRAFSEWYLMSAEERIQIVAEAKNKVPSSLIYAFEYQYDCTSTIIKQCESLISPTGETNKLYTQGRGVSILLVESDHDKSLQAVIAILVSMLLSGNGVVVCSDNKELNEALLAINQVAALPEHLLEVGDKASYSNLIQQDIRNFAYVGDKQKAIDLNRELSMRPTAITNLVAETDLVGIPIAKDPMLALHFVTERVRTTNITAIGGNAMLLELGSDRH